MNILSPALLLCIYISCQYFSKIQASIRFVFEIANEIWGRVISRAFSYCIFPCILAKSRGNYKFRPREILLKPIIVQMYSKSNQNHCSMRGNLGLILFGKSVEIIVSASHLNNSFLKAPNFHQKFNFRSFRRLIRFEEHFTSDILTISK